MIFSAANALGNNQRKSDGHYSEQKPHAGQEKREETKEPENNKKMSISSSQILNDKKSYTYNADKIIGNGTFGVVYLSTVAETGEKVAIKKVFQDKRYKNRELLIIKELNHPNIVRLRHAFYTTGENQDEVFLNIVMDYIPETLSKILKNYRKQKQMLPNILVKLYAYQMFRAIAYLMGVGICHRDIKPQNMLIDPVSHVLKLCDFGSAKRLIKGEPNVAYICSRYYRAPELIFGATEYSNDIDTWSTGCVVAELMLGEPVFPGESAVDQLVEIIKILGTPTFEQVKLMNPSYNEFRFPQIKAHPWNKVFKPKVDPQAIDLVAKVLVYPPKERLRPLQALMHPFFNELRNENCRINNNSLPDLFNFTQEEISTNPELIEKLIPSWYKANGNNMEAGGGGAAKQIKANNN